MLAARALVIEGGELRKFCSTSRVRYPSCRPQGCAARPCAFVDRHDFALADIGDRFGSLQDLERLTRVAGRGLKFARKIERVPDRGIFRAEPVEREAARLLVAHGAQLIQKT